MQFQALEKAKMIKFLVSRGEIFCFNFDHTELKRSSKMIFSVSERHRWAVVGQRNTEQHAGSFVCLVELAGPRVASRQGVSHV